MSSRTHFLSVLVLACAAFPAQLFRVGLAMSLDRAAGPPRGLVALLRALWLPGAFLLVAGLVWYVAPRNAVLVAPAAWWWLAVAVAAGLAAPAVEIGAGAVVALARGQRVARVRLHERWGAGGAMVVAAAVAVAVAEEVIFRGVAIPLLVGPLGAPVAVAVSVTALAYGLNHLYFGWLTVAQKCLTGVLLGGLFVAAGYSLLVPLVAHVVQNLVVLVGVPPRRAASRRASAVEPG